jgi:hypothetical protein
MDSAEPTVSMLLYGTNKKINKAVEGFNRVGNKPKVADTQLNNVARPPHTTTVRMGCRQQS